MVSLALCSPVPPSRGPAAELVEKMLHSGLRQALGDERNGVSVFVENPYQVPGYLLPEERVRPIADLPAELRDRSRGDAGLLPIYVIGDSIEHVHQLPFVTRCPGIVVLLSGSLTALDAANHVELEALGVRGREFVTIKEEGQAEVGREEEELLSAIAAASACVVAGEASVAAELKRRFGIDADALAAGKEWGQLEEIADALPAGIDREVETPSDLPEVAAVIVSYNSRDVLSPCVDSLLAQDYPNLSILVVDNDSADGTAEFVRDRYPEVQLIESGGNLGFAEGNNLGFRSSQAKYFFLLNQDAIARRNCVRELVRVAELHPRIGAVAAKMLMDRCPSLINSAGTEMNEGRWAWDRGVGDRDEDPSPAPVEVIGGSGGALLLSGKAIRELGGFDPKYFMYFEDTDLCYRFTTCGYVNYYAPLATVRHDFHGDVVVDPEREHRRHFMSERNRLQTLIKNCSSKELRRVLPMVFKHDRKRWKHLKGLAKNGSEAASASASMIQKAWRWVVLHALSLVLRRRRVQRLRSMDHEGIDHLLLPGCTEGGHQGDVGVFHDRHSAAARSEIVMGESDRDCLGSGWHAPEQPPGASAVYRWCRSRAWFYLAPSPEHTHVQIRIASPIEPQPLKLFVEGREVLAVEVAADQTEFASRLPDDLPRDVLWEFTMECGALRPIDRDMGPDLRELGIIAFTLRLITK